MKNLTILTAIVLFISSTLVSCVPTDDTPTPTNPPTDNGSILEFSSVTMGNQNNSSAGCFMDVDNGTIYTLQQAYANQSAIDLVFYHDAPSNDAWFGCPAELAYFSTYDLNIETDGQYGVNKWTTKNPIKISNTDISVATFNGIKNAVSLTTVFEDDYHSLIGAQPNVQGGNVYKIKTNTGRIGLIRIHSVDGNGSSSGKIIFDLKVIK